jgi:multidrug efflux system membrane fusion protein
VKGSKVTRLLKRLFALAVICAIVAGVVHIVMLPAVQEKMGGGRRARGGGDGPVPVLASPARLGDMPVYLNGVGTAKARNLVTVRPQVDGRILSLNFKEGQDVKRGDVLAKIDPATYQAQLDQAVAKKALDEAQLDNAKRDMERYSALGGNVIAQKTIDTQRALVAQLTAQVKQDDAAIANAKAFLDYTTIVSPIDGRVGIRMVDEGNLVRASDAGLVVITEVRPISVLFTLPQQQLNQVNQALRSGPVNVEALDSDGRTALDRGTLQVVDNQVDSSTGTIRMKAEFPNTNLQLWPGQFVNVRLLIDTLKQVVVIPTQSVQRGPNGAFAYVVQTDDKVTMRPVAVTMQNETDAVIAKGLADGERVVTTGFARLKEGSRVTVAKPEDQKSGDPESNADTKTQTMSEARINVRTACADDIAKLCPNAERREARSCLQANAASLSDACKVATSAARGGKRSEAEARKADGSATQ